MGVSCLKTVTRTGLVAKKGGARAKKTTRLGLVAKNEHFPP
ncbi:hypothetical protein B4064_3703 [Caldibacillus thermoamylovorans]|nr:hypothetical protein B4064_3703 [Caldibacillus thermoamylovorans]